MRSPGGKLVARRMLSSRRDTRADTSSTNAVLDAYLQDGSETAIATDPFDPSNALAAFNEGWDFDPDIPLSAVQSGSSWQSTAFPNGSGVYAGYPFSPWAGAGNAADEFFTSFARHDLYPTDNTQTVVARSADGGKSFSPFFMTSRVVLQDRPMFDIDRTTARGGTDGVFDGRMYLTYDDWGDGSAYAGSWLDVIGANGSLIQETPVSTVGKGFLGSQFQPAAGINDGQFFLVSTSTTGNGATIYATFSEMTNGGATAAFAKSTLSWAPAGQQLGGSAHWGVNGHRIDENGFLEVDRSHGPHRGYLYFISNRNPNPNDPTQDQGDLYLSISYTRGTSWQTLKIPTHGGYTQFFPMLDVDAQGWIHVAYYENTLGLADNGVLNATRGDLYYTVSRDGGSGWTPPVRVNLDSDALDYEYPPNDLGYADYYSLGDYMQLQAAGTGSNTVAYVLWTGYNQYRSDDGVGSKKQRIYCTRLQATAAPGLSPGLLMALASLLGLTGGWAIGRQRKVPQRA